MLKTEPKDAGKNPLWKNFVSIFEQVDDDKKVVIPFVARVKCSSVLPYNSAKGDTSHNHHNDDAGTGRAGAGLLMNGPKWAWLYK